MFQERKKLSKVNTLYSYICKFFATVWALKHNKNELILLIKFDKNRQVVKNQQLPQNKNKILLLYSYLIIVKQAISPQIQSQRI